jgi:hypothetical protein
MVEEHELWNFRGLSFQLSTEIAWFVIEGRWWS